MSLILSIDTSTEVGSVALHENGNLLAIEIMRVEKSHAEFIHTVIEKVINQSNKSLKSVQAIAISSGPGSYTGMRIGLSVAKGLCFALDIPLIGIPTLKILATNMKAKHPTASILIAMIDARRMEVFCSIFNSTYELVESDHAHVLTTESYNAYLNDTNTVIAGNGMQKFKSLFHNIKATFIPDLFPSAEYMGKWALDAWNKKAFEDIAYFEPFYLKEFYTSPKKTTNE
jgi:tRNA threonylcarbamoyladenosine biosynthesis protein TsaB